MADSASTPASLLHDEEGFSQLILGLPTGLKARIYSLKFSYKFTSRLAACRFLSSFHLTLLQITLDIVALREKHTSIDCRIILCGVHTEITSLPGINFSIARRAATPSLGTHIPVRFSHTRNYMRHWTAMHATAVLP